jgi:ubiquinone/menaquinone biosynthesis C-methylase UbiE
MGDLLAHHASVGQGYDRSGSDTTGYDYEAVRLDRHSPVERAITERYLRRYISDGSTVVDIGVGVGHYSELLARRGCHVHLVDVSQRLLATTTARLETQGLGGYIVTVQHASATDLAFLPDSCCDAVLLLGPLYHLGDPLERRRAIAEAARVLRVDGLVFAAGINRLALFRDDIQKKPAGAAERAGFYRGVLHDGNFPAPEEGGPSGVHLTTIEEFRAELSTAFTPLVLVGTESFASAFQESFLDLSEADAALWLDVIEQTGRTIEGLGYADHLLFIGRR